ncbi:amidohydrolase family protein [Cysteiniphilum halobium]|uniref:amidohydrolase family protein n=1 Tax=Cysteiniphilum halobium TaxID=2219059 RepID=UPI000E650CF7|nr:amidohydrolase family protein [Cysteiniphilum halobium]
MQIIDTHVHFWDLNQNINSWVLKQSNEGLKQNFLPQSLQQKMCYKLYGAVHIEAHDSCIDTEVEIKWLMKVAQKCPELQIKHIAYVDMTLARKQFIAKLDKLKQYPQVVGIRHILAYEKAVDYSPELQDLSMHPNLLTNLQILADYGFIFDCQAYPQQLLNLAPYLKASQIKTAIEHCGLPLWDHNDQRMLWQQSMQVLSEIESVSLKLSGLQMLGQTENNKAIVEYAIDCFGYQRVMYASNNPVCFRDDPLEWFETLYQLCGGKKDIFYDNAFTFYQF